MSAASVLSMGFAGVVGDAVGVREVLFAAGAITGVGFLVSLVGYHLGGRAREATTAGAPDGAEAVLPVG